MNFGALAARKTNEFYFGRHREAARDRFSYLLYHGGTEPRTRIRRPDALSLDERELISRGLARGDSMRSIAKDLNRAASSIS